MPRVATTRAPVVHTAMRNPLAWVALVAVYFLWGSTYPAIRVAVETIPPLLMAGVRYMLAGAILLPVALRFGDRDGDRPGRAQWIAAGVFGLALITGGNGGLSWGEQSVPAGTAALIVAGVPMWMVVLDRVVNGVRIGLAGVAGLLIGFTGVALLVNPSFAGGVDPLGATVILFCSMSWAAGSVYSRGARMPRRPLVGTGIAMLVGGATLVAVGVIGGELGALSLGEVSRSSALAMLWLVGPGSLLGFSAYTYALSTLPTRTVSTYAYVNPMVAVTIGWVLLGEQLSGQALLAGALVLSAVALILTTRARSARPGTPNGTPGTTGEDRAQADQPGVTRPDS